MMCIINFPKWLVLLRSLLEKLAVDSKSETTSVLDHAEKSVWKYSVAKAKLSVLSTYS